MLYLIQFWIKLNLLFYLLEIIPVAILTVGIYFKKNKNINSRKDITIGIFCIIFIFLSFSIIEFTEHIGPYSFNDIGKN